MKLEMNDVTAEHANGHGRNRDRCAVHYCIQRRIFEEKLNETTLSFVHDMDGMGQLIINEIFVKRCVGLR